MTKESIYNGEKTVFSINEAEKTGQLHVKEIRTLSNTMYKNKLKRIKDLKVTLDTIILLE